MSSFWIQLWKSPETGNRNGKWLEDIRSAIYSRVPPPSEKTWKLDTMKATQVLTRKKNWSAPGPDRLTNFWWKKAKVLHEGVAMSLQTIANINIEYPAWLSGLKAKPHYSRNPENSPVITRGQSPV